MSPLRGHLAILGRRKWYLVVAFVCALSAALAYSFSQAKRFEATATVLLSQNLAGALDTSPLLNVSDAVTLSAAVDGLLLIVRSDAARRNELREFRRVLSSTQAMKLGFVLTGSDSNEVYAGSYYARETRVD